MRFYFRPVPVAAFLGATILSSALGTAVANLPDAEHLVSQKGRRFGPETVSLRAGERVTIVNDDGDFVHHAYIEDPDYPYDSGDIEPGARAVVTFPKAGEFTVLCGIHPKMKLAVHVQ